MICPRCGNTWDVSKSPCSHCGLLVRLPRPSGAASHTLSQSQVSFPLMDENQTDKRQVTKNASTSSVSQTRLTSSPSFSALPQHRDVNASLDTSLSLVPPQNTGSFVVKQPSQQLPALRPNRLVTLHLSQQEWQMRGSGTSFSRSSLAEDDLFAADALPALKSGMLMREGRYYLRECTERQEWRSGLCEVWWIALDAQRSGAQVWICELILPESHSVEIQSMLRTATISLTSIGRHTRIPRLWDAFGELGRKFFVFAPVEGESLYAYMRRTGRALPERDVIACCVQMTEVLDILSQQPSPVIHGLIHPKHIIKVASSDQYVLTNFSIVLAGGARQFMRGLPASQLSPYVAPEFSQGLLDGRSDLYALMATAYHVATGSRPLALFSEDGNLPMEATIPHAQRLNPKISARFAAILAKGLHPDINQRYQRPTELREELLTALRSLDLAAAYKNPVYETPVEMHMPMDVQPLIPPRSAISFDASLHTLPVDNQKRAGVEDIPAPQAEDVALPKNRRDLFPLFIWLTLLLVGLILILFLSRIL